MLLLRKLHLYLGTLFAPAIIFFAFSGILQVIGLHEAEDAQAPQPPHWIVLLASVHKDQRLPQPKAHKLRGAVEQMRAEQSHDHAAATGDVRQAGTAPANTAATGVDWSQTLLKAFALLMAVGLIASAVIGIVIAFRNPRTRTTALVMLVLGAVLPLVLLAL